MITPIAYFDHDADIGIIGRGKTVEAAFINAAKAMFAIMYDCAHITNKIDIVIEFDESNLEFALITWLNLLITKAQTEHIMLAHFELSHKDGHWTGLAKGEPWREDIEPGVEVKGATLTMLKVENMNHAWQAQCIVDV